MNDPLIPLEFVVSKATLNWGDLLWAYRRNLLSWRDLVAMANSRRSDRDTLEIELSTVGKESVWKVSELAGQLAEKIGSSNDQSELKWLVLCLAWAFENRATLPDVLGEVERIYADFNYPPEMNSFVRFLPPSEGYLPAQHSKAENLQRLLTNLQTYLEKKLSSLASTA